MQSQPRLVPRSLAAASCPTKWPSTPSSYLCYHDPMEFLHLICHTNGTAYISPRPCAPSKRPLRASAVTQFRLAVQSHRSRTLSNRKTLVFLSIWRVYPTRRSALVAPDNSCGLSAGFFCRRNVPRPATSNPHMSTVLRARSMCI